MDAPNHALCEAHGLPVPGIAQSPQPWVLESALAAWELKHQAVPLGNWGLCIRFVTATRGTQSMSCGRAAAYAGRTYDILRHPTTLATARC